MMTFTIQPTLGIRNDVPPDSPEMFQFITEGLAKAHCADSNYVGYDNSYVGRIGSATKTGARTIFLSTNATLSGTMSAIGLAQLHSHDGAFGDVNYFAVTNHEDLGRLYRWTSGGSAVALTDGAGNETDLLFDYFGAMCCFRQAGQYMLVSSYRREGTGGSPQCNHSDDTTILKLIASGSTEFSFRYLEYFQNRVFGGYSDLLNGNGSYDIRWSGLNSTFPRLSSIPDPIESTFDFGVDNNLFYPERQPISGMRVMNQERLFVYSHNSISEITYLANYASPFAIKRVVSGFGAVSDDSIVEAGGVHFFYDKANGFCVFDGYSVKIISGKIQETIDTISPIVTVIYAYGSAWSMQGCHIDRTKEVAWACSANGTTNTFILYYNYITGNWRKDPLSARCVSSGYKVNLEPQKVMMLANGADVYYHGLNASNAGSDYDAYRIEPVLNFSGMDRSLILEIWFNSARNLASGLLDVYYRGASTVGQLEGLSWTALGSTTLTSPDNAVVRPPASVKVNNRYHQIKWGSDATSDLFSIREIQFRFIKQGRY